MHVITNLPGHWTESWQCPIPTRHKTGFDDYDGKVSVGFHAQLRWLGLLLIALTFFVVSGCNDPNRVLVGEFKELLGEERINETVELGTPILKDVHWGSGKGIVNIIIQQNKTVKYDLQNHHKIFGVYERPNGFSSERRSDVDAIAASVIGLPLLPLVIAEGTAHGSEYDSKKERGRSEAISELKSGSEQTQKRIVRYYTGTAIFKSSQHTFLYWKELIRHEYTRKADKQQLSEMIFPLGIPIKVTGLVTGNEATEETNSGGTASIQICNTLKDSVSLKPISLNILAEWEGKWVQLGKAALTDDIISRIIQSFQQEGMAIAGTPKLPPYSVSSVEISDAAVEADTDCQLSLTVENTGKGEFYRLAATSESLVPSLDGLRFEFGKLDPNDSLTLTKKVHIPRGQPTGPVNVSFMWSELNGYEPDPVHARLLVKGLPRPVFATSVKVLDDNSGNSVGNGDGRIQKGEAVDLLVTVKNAGNGIARETSVRLEGIETDGVIVNVAEQDLGEIAVGETKQAHLTVTTKKAASISRLTPTIHVVDRYFDVEQKEQLALALESELPPSIMAYDSKAYVVDDEIAVRGGAGNETAVIARARAGSILKTTGELGEWIRVELPKVGTGWVYRSEISFEPTAQTVTSAQRGTSGIVEILEKAAPLIVLAKPHNNSSFLVSKIEVSGVIADNQTVQRVVYRVNGKEITSDGKRAIGVEALGQGSMQREVNFAFSADLTLGDNEIEITAWDNEGLQSQKVISVTYEKEKGNVYIACIGVDKYKSVPQLKYAAADAQAMAQRLRDRLDVPEENVYVLLDEEATLTNIKSTLGVKIRQQANKADTVIIYFSGHGAPEADPRSPDADGVNKYLLPIEAEKDSLYATALPMDEVRNIFRRLISERVIFLADTCYSGAAGGRTLMPGGTQYRSINQDNLLTRLRDTGKGRVILTASQGSEVSQEKDELGHGVFTYYLLRGLDGKADANADQTITVSELYDYVSKEVPKATKNTQHPMMKLDEMVGEVIIGVLE